MVYEKFEDDFYDEDELDEVAYSVPTTAIERTSGSKAKYAFGFGKKRAWSGLSDFWRNPWSKRNDDPRTITGAGKNRQLSGIDSMLMAKHLRSIRSTCYLVFSKKAVNVQWASDDMSYTDIDGGNIRVSPAPLLTIDKTYEKWTVAQRLDVVHGLALHEAAHNAHTPSLSKAHCEARGGMLLAQLFNIFEDIYIEHQVGSDFPGFVDYFEAKDDYYFSSLDFEARLKKLEETDLTDAGVIPDESDPAFETTIKEQIEKLGAIVDVMIPFMRHRGTDIESLRAISPRHSQAVDVLLRARENGDILRDTKLSIDTRIQSAQATYVDLLSMFMNLPEEVIKQQSAKAAGAFEKAGIREMLREIFQRNGVEESSGNTAAKDEATSPAGSVEKDEEEGVGPGLSKRFINRGTEDEIEALIEADLRDMEVEQYESGYGGEMIDKVTVLDMKRLPYADKRYAEISKRSQKHTRKLMNTLKFRAEDRIYKEREREHGRIDATRLTNLKAFKSNDIFYQTIKAEAPKVHVGILVDESGSMRSGSEWGYGVGQRKMDVAVQTAIMMANALQQVPSTTYEIWGHSGDMYGGRHTISSIEHECGAPVRGGRFMGPTVMRYLDSRAGLTDARVLGRIAGRGNNYDGPALECVGKEMAKNAPNDRKVLFVICDGMPSGGGYGGSTACEDVANRRKKIGKQGVEVISIFVGTLGSARAQMEIMYGKENKGWLHCPNAEELPQLVEKISSRLLRWEGA